MSVLSRDQVAKKSRILKNDGKKIVFTNGCFDLLHTGHLKLFEEASAQGDYLVVGLNTDASVRRLKGSDRPILPENERAQLLDALIFVDAVVLFDEDTPEQLIKALVPDVLVKGADYEKDEIVGAAFVESRGGEIYRVRLKEGQATTDIIAKIRGEKS